MTATLASHRENYMHVSFISIYLAARLCILSASQLRNEIKEIIYRGKYGKIQSPSTPFRSEKPAQDVIVFVFPHTATLCAAVGIFPHADTTDVTPYPTPKALDSRR